MVCEMGSGGVRIAPTTNAPISTQERARASPAGVVTPVQLVDRPTTFQRVARIKAGSGATGPIEYAGGTGHFLKAAPIRSIVRPAAPGPVRAVMALSSVLPIPVAYWAADEINIADDTFIVMKQPHHWLVIIANKITIGANVQ